MGTTLNRAISEKEVGGGGKHGKVYAEFQLAAKIELRKKHTL